MDRLQLVADLAERRGQAVVEGALELLVHGGAHLLELARVVLADGGELPHHGVGGAGQLQAHGGRHGVEAAVDGAEPGRHVLTQGLHGAQALALGTVNAGERRGERAGVVSLAAPEVGHRGGSGTGSPGGAGGHEAGGHGRGGGHDGQEQHEDVHGTPFATV